MSKEYQNIKSHLESHPKNYIDVENYNTKASLGGKLFSTTINDKYGDLNGYLSQLVNDESITLQVFCRKEQGSGTRIISVQHLTLTPKITEPIKPKVQPIQNNFHNNSQPNFPQDNNGQLNGSYNSNSGLNSVVTAQTAELFLLKQQLVTIKEANVELKAERNEFRDEVKTLRRERDDLQSKVSLSERERAFALKEAAINNKGFFETDAGQLFLSGAVETVGSVLAKKGTAVVQPQEHLASAQQHQNFSKTKQALFSLIEPNTVTDIVCEKLYLTLHGIQNVDEFASEHNNLLNKFKIKTK